MVASLQNTGVINPSEAPAIEAMLPDPRSMEQMTFGTLQGRLHSFRQEIDSQVTSALATRGVDEDGIHEALRQLHGAIGASRPRDAAEDAAPAPTTPAGTAAPAPTAPPADEMVRMRLPSGEIRRFPASSVEQAQRLGAVRL
jgi:hypothetical protein